MNIPKTYITQTVALILALVLTACNGGGSSSDTGEAQAAEEEFIQESTLISEPDTVPAKPAKPQIVFADTQAALDYMQDSPHASEYAAGILPRMAEDELSYAAKLLNSEYDNFLIIDKELMRVGLFDRYGREILSYGIAGSRNYGTKHKKADSRTPEGFFSVGGIYDSSEWLFTDDNGHTSKVKGQFGPRFIRIKNPVSSQIGLHGTRAPGSIGRRTSHGCIRVTNEHILELVKHVTVGMPVIISPSRRDQAVNEKEGYSIPMITMDPWGKYSSSPTAEPTKPKEKHHSEEPAHHPDTLQLEPVSFPEPIIPEAATPDTVG